jgi:hypothetical protein
MSVELKKVVVFKIRRDLKITNANVLHQVKFKATFEEALTGQKFTKEVTVWVHKNDLPSLQIVGSKKNFKPGFAYKLKTAVERFDGTLETDQFFPVELSVIFFFKPLPCTPFHEISDLQNSFAYEGETFLKNGVAHLTLNIPENTTAILISAKYKNVKASLTVVRQESKAREFLAIKSKTSK